MTYRILVTGSRYWTDKEAIREQFLIELRFVNYSNDYGNITVVNGAAAGADDLARVVADEMGMTTEEHPANWPRYKSAAGPKRNQKMVDLGADVCVPFALPGSVGTYDCLARARMAGIPIRSDYWDDILVKERIKKIKAWEDRS